MAKEVLTKRQNQILEFIKIFIQKNQRAPTVREICKEFKFKSTNSAYQYINTLVKKGYLKKVHGARGVIITDVNLLTARQDDSIKRIPVISNYSAQNPLTMFVNSDESIKISRELAPDTPLFAVKVPDDGMSKDGIFKGDIAVVNQKPNVENGKIIFAVYEETGFVRYYKTEGNIVCLIPSNRSYDKLELSKNDPKLWIGGEVVLIIRKL